MVFGTNRRPRRGALGQLDCQQKNRKCREARWRRCRRSFARRRRAGRGPARPHQSSQLRGRRKLHLREV